MAEHINLKPIQEEHVKTLTEYLDSMGIGAAFSEADFVQDTTSPPENCRQKCITLEGTSVDKMVYVIMQNQGKSRSWQSGVATENNWSAFCLYAVECHIGKDKKIWKNLNAKVKVKCKRGDIIDFKWTGGKIADTLNRDTVLKKPLLDDMNGSIRAGGETEVAIWPKLALADTDIRMMARVVTIEGVQAEPENAIKKYEPVKEGVMLLGCSTRGYRDEKRPLILPSREGFMAYDRIARHLRDYVNTNVTGNF